MLTLDMQPAQELRGLPGVDWWRLDLKLPEVRTDKHTYALECGNDLCECLICTVVKTRSCQTRAPT